MASTAPRITPAAAIHPLCEFYSRSGLALPRFEVIGGGEVPSPFRELLVHDRDMTPTLQEHFGADIHIDVLGRERRGEAYFREVVLRLDGDDRPVEFGANRIALELLPPFARRLVLEEQLPFGQILKAHEIEHVGGPEAFLRVEADQLMCRAFGLERTAVLYGRHNTLRDVQGRALSEVVEILPPWVERTRAAG